jgi:hypothetical protein
MTKIDPQVLTIAPGATDRIEFLRQRRADLVERVRVTEAAIRVLDDKIRYYGG